ncbi:MAG TPA: nucleotidyltransferase family protein [Blastocatellia bacterium]|nr:nucleotidyltransferase family protein [Blastocatellia bacterium]
MTDAPNQTPKTNAVCAIILAAGQSSRMGAFKPLLPFGNTTVIEHSIDHLRRGGIETIVVVVGHRAGEIRTHLQDMGIIFAINPDAHSAMAASILHGVRALPNEARAVVITPVDHPAVPSEVVSELIDEWRAGARLVIPTNEGRGGHPVLIDLSFRNELLNLDPARGLKSLFDAHRSEVTRVPVDSNYIARDMDTWDDYRSLHLEVFGVLPAKAQLPELQTMQSKIREETN